MSKSHAALLGLGTFIVALALCVALFAALDVKLLFLVGAASYAAYRSALSDTSRSAGTRPS